MAKKYLSLEEAAAILGVKPDDLVRLRERGEIRGFADRGTWKFKSEDVEEFQRQRHPDSNPDVPLLMDDSSSEVSVLGDSDEVAEQATVIRGDSSGKVLDGASDSDVRLIVDDDLVGRSPDSDPEVALPPLSDTDSDVRLVDERSSKKRESDSDSDVVISADDSDSDVKLVGSDSDSDVRLVGEGSSKVGDTDSDVALVDVDDTQPMKMKKNLSDSSSVLADDSTVRRHASEDSGLTLESESGMALAEPDSGKLSEFDSGITLESSDSGISLESVDSGISLDTGDSGISLDAGDSGISLEVAGDSGISLDDSGSYALADDSGIEVGSPSDSGIALDAIDTAGGSSKKLARTAPMDSSGDDDLEVTQMEMDSTPVQKSRGKDTDAETSVILFDDEEAPAPKAKAKAKAKAPAPESSVEDFDTLESQTFGLDDSFVEAVDFEDQDLEVVEDVLGDSSSDFEDIESLEEMDVFDAADEDFEEGITDKSGGEFTPQAASGPVMVRAEQQWGTGTVVGLAISSICMVVCAMMMFDLVRSMWTYQEPTTFGGVVIDTFKGFFSSK